MARFLKFENHDCPERVFPGSGKNTCYEAPVLARVIIPLLRENKDLSAKSIQASIFPYTSSGITLKFADRVKKYARLLLTGTPQVEIAKVEAYAELLRKQGNYVEIIYDTAAESIDGINRAVLEAKHQFNKEQDSRPPGQRASWVDPVLDFSEIESCGAK